jgi:mediator of RNA polymerase II transcription subunit 6
MATAPDPPPDQTATQWRDDAWLSQWPLTRATALDYFAGSPFYDRGCANEAARAQGLAIDQLA